MAVALTITDHWSDGKRIHVVGNLALSGNYVTGGDTIPINDPLIKTGSRGISYAPSPIYSYDGDITYRFVFRVLSPTSLKLKVIAANGAEHPQGAYLANMIAHPPGFYVIFHKMV